MKKIIKDAIKLYFLPFFVFKKTFINNIKYTDNSFKGTIRRYFSPFTELFKAYKKEVFR